MSKFHAWFMAVIFVTFLPACSSSTFVKVKNLKNTYQAKEQNCSIQFYINNKPEQKYEVIGDIESHIEKNFFLGGKVQLEDEAFRVLRKKACSLGGDAVIINDHIETSVSETTHIHVWATVIKYLKTE
jgi:hypothetical protein